MIEWQPKDTVELILKEAAIVNGLWQNYAAVSGVLIAFSVSAKDMPGWGRVGAALAFWVFSWGNLTLIRQGARVQEEARRALQKAPNDDGLVGALYASVNTERGCRNYHLAIDTAVTLAIWLPALFTRWH
ncbi:MAG: hypothetical protein QM756_34880 [Polyangiaceae bacterium]